MGMEEASKFKITTCLTRELSSGHNTELENVCFNFACFRKVYIKAHQGRFRLSSNDYQTLHNAQTPSSRPNKFILPLPSDGS